MDNRAIGVFDSGLGGLTVVKELHRLLPGEDIVYLGDTGRIPYGSRSRETIIKYASQDIDFLLKKDIKMIVAACGTVSSNYPKAMADQLPVPYLDVILPTAQTACALSRKGRIGVTGTAASLRSNAYGKAIRNIRSDARVFGNACPLLVHLVENGLVQPDNPITRLTVQMYLEPLMKEEIDTLILGCTHYPIIYEVFNSLMDYKVTLVDPGRCTAKAVQCYLARNQMLSEKQEGGASEYNVTDDLAGFEASASLFLGEPLRGKGNLVSVDDQGAPQCQ